ncbi:hypothetical protein Tco_0950626, partial [Tanacetum coccineum]
MSTRLNSITTRLKRRPSGIAFRDTSSVLKKKSPDPSQKLKDVQTLTPEEQLTADTMKALKESKKTNRRQLGTGGSSEGTGSILRVPNESTVVPATSSEGTRSEQESEYSDEDDNDDDDDDKSSDLEKTDDEETDNEFVHSGE